MNSQDATVRITKLSIHSIDISRAVTITFLTISVLLAIGLGLFLGGLVLHRGVCVPLEYVRLQILFFSSIVVFIEFIIFAEIQAPIKFSIT